MDQRRFLTETKAAVVAFLEKYLNSEEFSDLWGEAGAVDVTVARPGWAIADKLTKPIVLLEKADGETDFTAISDGEYMKEGYRKTFYLDIHSCTADGPSGGKITVDDLSSSIEVIFMMHRQDLAEQGINIIEMTDSAEVDERAQYENVSSIQVQVVVAGANIRALDVELGRMRLTAAGQGVYYDGAEITTPALLECRLIKATTGTEVHATVWAINEDLQSVPLSLVIPRATAGGTRVALTGGLPGEKYTDVANIELAPGTGQAGYEFGVYNTVA
jgi:hypothetical protein